MSETREQFIETLKDSYSAYYDIIPNDGMTELPLVFRGDFNSRGERYWFTKSVKIWANETNEHVYLFSAPHFDAATADKCIDFAIANGEPLVKPHKEHNYTNFHAVFVADSFDDDAIRLIKKRSYDKSYNHSLWGYSLLKSAAVRLADEKIFTNRAGHDLGKFFRKLFAVRAKAEAANGK